MRPFKLSLHSFGLSLSKPAGKRAAHRPSTSSGRTGSHPFGLRLHPFGLSLHPFGLSLSKPPTASA
ncbi:MAG: hypothetical protein ACO305_14970, partial [Rubrivivax sp.]